MKKFLIIAFFLLMSVISAKAECLLSEPCAAPESSLSSINEISKNISASQRQSLKFLPDPDRQNVMNQQSIINQQNDFPYNPAEDNYHRPSTPRDCVFGLCLP